MQRKSRFSLVALTAISAAFILAACQSRESELVIQQKTAVRQNIQNSIDDIDNQMENLRASLQTPEELDRNQMMNKQNQMPMGATHDKSKTGMDGEHTMMSPTDKQEVIKEQLADLQDFRGKFTEKLNSIETVSSDEWNSFQKDVNDLQSDYRQSLQDYAAEISNENNSMMDKDGAMDGTTVPGSGGSM